VISWLLPQNKGLLVLFDDFMTRMVPILYQNKQQDKFIRFRMGMLISFTVDFLFETTMDVNLKEASIDTVLRCLFEDIHSTKKTRILSLVALQTLKTTTGDDNLGLRIQVNFDEILQRFSEYITSIKVVDFFEFIYDFIQRFHSHFTKDNL